MDKQLYVVWFVKSMRQQLFATLYTSDLGARVEFYVRKHATKMPRAQAQAVAAVVAFAQPNMAGKLFIEEAP